MASKSAATVTDVMMLRPTEAEANALRLQRHQGQA